MRKLKMLVTSTIIFIIVVMGTTYSNTINDGSNDVRQIEILYVSDLVPEKEIEVIPDVPEEPIMDKQYNEDDLYWLSRIISAESRGESVKGQIAVGNVVMNRVKSDKFPNTIKEVIFQKGQFCPVRNKSIYKDPTEQSVESAKRVLDGEEIVSGEAVYFYAPKWTSRSNWIRSRKVVNEIGVHRFAK